MCIRDRFGIAWNVLPHVGDDEARPQVIEVAGRRSDYNPDGFCLVEGRLGISAHAPQQQAQNRKDIPFHIAPPLNRLALTVIAAGLTKSNVESVIEQSTLLGQR